MSSAIHIPITIISGEALTGKAFHAIAINDGKVAANGAESGGLLQEETASIGSAVPLTVIGRSFCVAGAAFSLGALLKVNTSGRLVTATTGTHVVARALAAAGADGDICKCICNFATPSQLN